MPDPRPTPRPSGRPADRPAGRPAGPPSRGLWALITLVLLPAIVLPLWVPLYDKVEPRLNGWPFFYWFQMAMILFATAMTLIALALSRVADRRDREFRSRVAGTPEPTGEPRP